MTREAIVTRLSLSGRDIEALAGLPHGYLATPEAPVKLLERVRPTATVDDGVRGAVLRFRRPSDPTEQRQPS